MSDPFLSSDQYADHAHELYSSGRFDEAVAFIKQGLAIYPASVELLVGLAYAEMAREEYGWARAAFGQALDLDPDHEEAMVGLGETLLRLGEREVAARLFDQVVTLGFGDDHDLMLQVARALFRENQFEEARLFFQRVAHAHPESSEGMAGLGYVAHRMGDDDLAMSYLQKALDLDDVHSEVRLYLGNVFYDRGEYEAALTHYERTDAADHFDELALWRLIELKKSIYKLPEGDPELKVWVERLAELTPDPNPEDRILAEVESTLPDGSIKDPRQLDLFGALLTELFSMRGKASAESHKVRTPKGTVYTGTWQEIVLLMSRDEPDCRHASLPEYMERVARRNHEELGIVIPATDAAAFVQASAAAGLLVILR